MDIRFVSSILDITFSPAKESNDEFKKEYRKLSDFEEDDVGQWLKLAKARGETSQSDDVLLRLMVELHKKIDGIKATLEGEKKEFLKLKYSTKICKIGFEHIMIEEELFEKDVEYYSRISMPTFPKREMPIFLEAIDNMCAKIVLINQQDQKDWNAYVAARERAEIREKRSIT